MEQLKRVWKAAVSLFKFCVICLCVGGAFIGAMGVSAYIDPPKAPDPIVIKERVEVPVEVERSEASVRELIETIPPKYGISPLLAAAIVERESGGKKDAIRFEPGQVERARKLAPKGSSKDTINMYASSHCFFQVMGWHAPSYDMSWADLYKPQTCAEVAMAILKNCMDRHEGKKKVDQIHGALTCYNGSTQYADAVLGRLGELLIEQAL